LPQFPQLFVSESASEQFPPQHCGVLKPWVVQSLAQEPQWLDESLK
jgi:hypothetical protein